MAELIVHTIDCVEPPDCLMTLEIEGTECHLFARRVCTVPMGGDTMKTVGAFEPVPLFHTLALNAFQVRELVRLCNEIRAGKSLTFPLRIRAVR